LAIAAGVAGIALAFVGLYVSRRNGDRWRILWFVVALVVGIGACTVGILGWNGLVK
jgi:hypothetical protein